MVLPSCLQSRAHRPDPVYRESYPRCEQHQAFHHTATVNITHAASRIYLESWVNSLLGWATINETALGSRTARKSDSVSEFSELAGTRVTFPVHRGPRFGDHWPCLIISYTPLSATRLAYIISCKWFWLLPYKHWWSVHTHKSYFNSGPAWIRLFTLKWCPQPPLQNLQHPHMSECLSPHARPAFNKTSILSKATTCNKSTVMQCLILPCW